MKNQENGREDHQPEGSPNTGPELALLLVDPPHGNHHEWGGPEHLHVSSEIPSLTHALKTTQNISIGWLCTANTLAYSAFIIEEVVDVQEILPPVGLTAHN